MAVGRKFTGEIDSSILALPGVHARLEDISESGQWLRSHSFCLAGVETVREQGQSVGNIMQAWRKLRAESQELLQGLRIWQSPTAFVDSVIWSWQQEEESGRFENLFRLVDSLSTHWTVCSARLHSSRPANRYRLCNASQGSPQGGA